LRGWPGRRVRLDPAAWLGWLAAELIAERERWLLWLPVGIGCGAAVYFALPSEPPPWIAGGGLLLGLAALWALRRRPLAVLLPLAAIGVSAGLGAAQIRTLLVTAPVLPYRLVDVAIGGRVADLQSLPTGQRLFLADPKIAGLAAAATPARLRLRIARLPEGLRVGDRVNLKASIGPPGPPSVPGIYDFQRDAFFDGIGGVGFAYAVVLDESGPRGPPGDWLSRLRQSINRRILTALPGEEGPVAVALMTGDQSGIAKDILQAMRDSGLAHLLSISGLHMAIVAGVVFLGLRSLLALIPRLALYHPTKKWAAVAAIVATFAYLMLSGDSVPPQRSFVMTSLVLLAVLFDRNPLSMRLVAWAAMVVLLTTPDAITGPSFQMSFAAVVALIAAYETVWVRRWSRGEGGALSRLAHHVGALALTSLIATAATAPYAIYHFNRMSDYSVVANLLAVPLTSFWIMPWAVAAFLLMPLGLESLALTPMGWGIDGVLAIARAVAAWPGAVTLVPAMPLAGLGLITFGGLWLCLWQRPWRLAGLVGIAAGFLSIALATPPDLLIGDDGKLIALRGGDGRLLLSTRRAGRFDAEVWLKRAGQDEPVDWDTAAGQADSGLTCDLLSCLVRRNGHLVALVKDPAALAEDCRAADLVVSLEPVRVRCPSAQRVIDRFDLWRNGGHAVWLWPDGVEIQSVRGVRGDRPWVVQPQPRRSPASSAAAAPPVDPAP